MHLYVIREPDVDRVWHLHPEMTSSGVFTQALPPIPPANTSCMATSCMRAAWRKRW